MALDAVKVLEWFAEAGVVDVLGDNLSRKPEVRSAEIKTLPQLKEAMAAVDIPLRDMAQNMVFGTGDEHAKLLLLGEAPGAEEDAQGLPFVGQSGQLLDMGLKAIGLQRSEVYITNILPWRPPGNRTPNTQEIALFRPFVLKHISLINPRVVLCLGGTATKALLQSSEGIMKLRGKWTSISDISAKILPTFHPAYLLRSPSQKREFWHDLLMIKQEIEAS